MGYKIVNMKTKGAYTTVGGFEEAVEIAEDMARLMDAPIVVFEMVPKRVYTARRPIRREGGRR